MYKELVIRNLIVIAVSLAIFFSLSLLVVNFVNRRNTENELVYLSEIIGNQIKDTNSEEEIRSVVDEFTENQQWLNIVIATSLGDIVIDSAADALPQGVHTKLEAFEMEKLNEAGDLSALYVNGIRIYYITRLNEDIIFRTSVALEDSTNFILLGTFILVAVLAVVLLVSMRLSEQTSKRITDAFGNISRSLRSTAEGKYIKIEDTARYEEVDKAYKDVNEVNKNIFTYMSQISLERDKLTYIIDNINEGIAIIGISGRVYAINELACTVFGKKKEDVIDTCTEVFDDEKMHKFFEKEKKTKSEIHFDYYGKRTDSIYLVSLNYFKHNHNIGEEDLISIVLYDVTALRKEERIKADFIANASHELKTPITSISGFSELLLSGLVTSPSDAKKYIGNIHEESKKMKETVDELLYLSKLDYSDELTSVISVDLSSIIKDSIIKFEKAAEQKDVSITNNAQSVFVNGNPNLLTHMVCNLLDNAIKYNRPHGSVIIESGLTADERAYVKISDTGYGIQSQNLNKLFDRFYRVDNSRNRETGGTGLGLTIVQKICALHGANVQVESEYEKGTTFTVTFGKEETDG